MPFLTDRLQDTQRKQRHAEALADENERIVDHSRGESGKGAVKSRFTFDLDFVEQELRATIVGQDETLEQVMEILKIVRADIGDPRKPLASILFCGPTGVGKTETVRTLARAFYGDADSFCRVDMNTLSQEHYAAALTGAPPGYVGSKEGTTILDQEKIEGTRNLPGIVLFDEVEKASNEVVLALMNVFDNGLLTVASGERTYSFRNSLIFMSSNLGAHELMSLEDGAPAFWRRLKAGGRSRREQAQEIVLNCLLSRFPPEFVNRIDHIDTFNWIGRDTMPALVDVEVERLNRRLKKHDLVLRISDEVRDFLSAKGYDKRFGARELRRTMRKYLEFPLASFLLDQDGLRDGAPLTMLVAERNDGKLSFHKT